MPLLLHIPLFPQFLACGNAAPKLSEADRMKMTPHADMGPSKWVPQAGWLKEGWLAGRAAAG
jgi:hypothetical protein